MIGQDEANEFWELYRENYVAQADIDKIAEWGFNHIRVPFHYKQFYDSTGTETPIGYAIVDELITWCQPHNIYIILDMHALQEHKMEAQSVIAMELLVCGLRIATKNLQSKFGKKLHVLCGPYLIAGYDLINEPVLPSGVSLEEFKQLYVDITEAIREVDNNHLIWIEGNWYGTDFAGLTPPWDDNMGYSFHKYWGQTDISTIQSYINLRNNYGVPLWMGESGENSNHWYYEVFKLLEENNIGWNFWTHKKVDKITSPYSALVTPQYQVIIDYLRGVAGQPDPNIAGMGLTSFANSLKIENCITRPGVIASLTDPDYGEISKPYATHSIIPIITIRI